MEVSPVLLHAVPFERVYHIPPDEIKFTFYRRISSLSADIPVSNGTILFVHSNLGLNILSYGYHTQLQWIFR
jgi:hypothetical protein